MKDECMMRESGSILQLLIDYDHLPNCYQDSNMMLSFVDMSTSSCSSTSSSSSSTSSTSSSEASRYPLVSTFTLSVRDLRKKIAGCADEEMVKFTIKEGACVMTVTGKRCAQKDTVTRHKRRVMCRSPERHEESAASEDNTTTDMPTEPIMPTVTSSVQNARVNRRRPRRVRRQVKKKQKHMKCPICPPYTVHRNSLRRHAVEFHLPWFVVPDLACWTCREPFRAKERLREHIEASCVNGGFDDLHVTTWCHLMNNLISRLRFDLNCRDNKSLMTIAKGITDTKSTNVLFMQQEELSLLICHAEYQGSANVDRNELSLHIMGHESCLVDWRVIFWLIAETDNRDMRELALTCTSVPVGAVDDSHCHLKEWANHHGMTERMVGYVQEGDPNLGRVITNWCWPNRWLEIPCEVEHYKDTEILHTMGVHPNVVGQQGGLSHEEWARLESLLDRKEVVGLGEVGLDYKKTTNLRGQLDQRRFLRHAADLARERKLPMVLHLRGRCSDEKEEIHFECIDILRERLPSDAKLHVHCFSGPMRAAQSWLSHFPNTMFGCGPVIMGNNVPSDVREAFIHLPSTALLLETDAPYYRCKEIEHPWQVSQILNRLASWRQEAVDILGSQIYKNCTKMYKS